MSRANRTPTQASSGLQNPLHSHSATEAAGEMCLPQSAASTVPQRLAHTHAAVSYAWQLYPALWHAALWGGRGWTL